MERYNRLWRSFIAIGIAAIAIQQLIYADFKSVFLPDAYPSWLGARLVWAWVFSLALIAACGCILFDIKARTLSLLLGLVFLLLFICFQVPSVAFGQFHIGVWTIPFKELSLSAAAFLIAGTFQGENSAPDFIKLLAKLIPAAKYFFGFTLALFGVMHFAYPDFCAALVPRWMHFYFFWMYFAAVALIAGGFGIMLKPTRRLAGLLTGIMLFLWVIILHIPRALADPHSGSGNEWTSVFEALAFSGIAFIISGRKEKSA